jgi:hypothetical protein
MRTAASEAITLFRHRAYARYQEVLMYLCHTFMQNTRSLSRVGCRRREVWRVNGYQNCHFRSIHIYLFSPLIISFDRLNIRQWQLVFQLVLKLT